MPINITNLINQIEAKALGADSTSDTTDLLNLIRLSQDYNQFNFQTVEKTHDLPSADSSTIGDVYYVRDRISDSFGSFYLGRDTGWNRFTLHADSAEDSAIAAANSGSSAPSFVYQGSTQMRKSGGLRGGSQQSKIHNVPFATEAGAGDTQTLTVARYHVAGSQSSTHSYASSGSWSSGNYNIIDKTSWTSPGNATDVGDLTVSSSTNVGSSSDVNGYVVGMNNPSYPPLNSNNYEKFPFASDTNSTVHEVTNGHNGQMNTWVQPTSFYAYGGYNQAPTSSYGSIIDEYSFASDGAGTKLGDLALTAFNSHYRYSAGANSTTTGYTIGGLQVSPASNYTSLQKFVFASDTTATSYGSVNAGFNETLQSQSGASSTDNGYTMGGRGYPNPQGSPNYWDTITKFPFALEGNVSNVGNLDNPASNGAPGHI